MTRKQADKARDMVRRVLDMVQDHLVAKYSHAEVSEYMLIEMQEEFSSLVAPISGDGVLFELWINPPIGLDMSSEDLVALLQRTGNQFYAPAKIFLPQVEGTRRLGVKIK